jgi:hypothetical protein
MWRGSIWDPLPLGTAFRGLVRSIICIKSVVMPILKGASSGGFEEFTCRPL